MVRVMVPRIDSDKMSSAASTPVGSRISTDGTQANGRHQKRRSGGSGASLQSLEQRIQEPKHQQRKPPSRSNSGIPVSDSECNLYSDEESTFTSSSMAVPDAEFVSQKTIPKLVIDPGMSAKDGEPSDPDSLPPAGNGIKKPASHSLKPKFQFCPNCGHQLVENPIIEPILRPLPVAEVPESDSDDNDPDRSDVESTQSVLKEIAGRRKEKLRSPEMFEEQEESGGGNGKVKVNAGNQAVVRGASRSNLGSNNSSGSHHRRVASVDHNIYSLAMPQKKGPLVSIMESNSNTDTPPSSAKKRGKPPAPLPSDTKRTPSKPKYVDQSDDEGRYTDIETPTSGHPNPGKGMHRRISSWADGGNLKHTDFILRKPYRDVTDLYELHDEELGVGQFGVIRSCVSKNSGKLLACKTISKERVVCPEDAEDVRKEVQLMQQLRGHPNIIELRETFEDPKHVHFVMELCKGGELFDRIKLRGQYSEPNAAWVCQTLVEALLYCHSNGIIHRDVKPENILLTKKDDDTAIKLIDFGVATRFRHGEHCVEFVGTPYYMAPEVLDGSYGPESDIWSAGIVLYIMLCGFPPFWSNSNEGIFEAIQQKEVQFKSAKWRNVSTEAKDLIRAILVKDPVKRITSLEILSHPWIIRHTRD